MMLLVLPVRKTLQAVQKLNIELYFDDHLQKKYGENPKFVLSERNVPISYLDLLPKVTTVAFQVECYGRQFLIVREISKHFKSFFKIYMNTESPELPGIISLDILRGYFRSENFFYSTHSFPHYTGAGLGYENSSKFFFFALEYISSKENRTDLELALYTAMASHIHFQAQFSNLRFYSIFKEGILFEVQGQTYAVCGHNRVRVRRLDPSDKRATLNSVIAQIVSGVQHEDI